MENGPRFMLCFDTYLLKEWEKLKSHKDLEPPPSVFDLNLRAAADYKTQAAFLVCSQILS